jgi:nitrite reductase/ring-hydroxylating ferredoxin subunit
MLMLVATERVVIGRCAEGIVVFSDPCTHKGFSHGRSSDRLRGSVPWHGSQFNTSTGRVIAGPGEVYIQPQAQQQPKAA